MVRYGVLQDRLFVLRPDNILGHIKTGTDTDLWQWALIATL